MKRYMFDTNIFNHILDRSVDITPILQGGEFFVTHIQFDEIRNTRDSSRRGQLLGTFKLIPQVRIATESALYGASGYGGAKYSSDDSLYKEILSKLDVRSKKPNNIQDALIAETAIRNNLLLVTDDGALFEVIADLHGTVSRLDDLLEDQGE